MGTSTDGSAIIYTTAPENTSRSIEHAESEQTEPGEDVWADAQLQDMEPQMRRLALKLKVNMSTGVVSSTPSTPSPVVHGGKKMAALKPAIEKENEAE